MHTFAGETTDAIQYPVIPSVVFTSPRIAKAGVTVAEAKRIQTSTLIAKMTCRGLVSSS